MVILLRRNLLDILSSFKRFYSLQRSVASFSQKTPFVIDLEIENASHCMW